MRPRIAIAHDYLTQRGGAERVVLSMSRAFPEAEIHTLFYAPEQTYPEFMERTVRTSRLNRVGMLRKDPRWALPLLAPAASALRIDADVVVASSSGWAHAFPTDGRRIVYCHSPARWLYLPDDYLRDTSRWAPRRLALAGLAPGLRRWDRAAALRAHRYLANSTVVRKRIRERYRFDADVVFPPFSPSVAEGETRPIDLPDGWAGGGDRFHLVVSRLQPYKHVDRVVEAFRDLPRERLLIIGRGPEGARLRASAPPNVAFAESVGDDQIRWAYAHAIALVAASHEDFGLTPLEAGAHGVPTIALHAGGYLDTVREGVNGTFFPRPDPAAIRDAIRESSRVRWSPPAIREHAGDFSESTFIDALHMAVDEVLHEPPLVSGLEGGGPT